MSNQRLYLLSDFLAHQACEKPFMAVLGHPVSHSKSPLIHNTALKHVGHNAVYYAIDVPDDQRFLLPQLFQNPNFCGANVTLPLKGYIKDLVHKRSEAVELTGSCNTIWPCSKGLICGENTDISGFLEPLRAHINLLQANAMLVFGSGGAARAVITALRSESSQPIHVVSRSAQGRSATENVMFVGYNKWTEVCDNVKLIVNCTPMGMYPDVNSSPVLDEQSSFLMNKICYDIVYNPINTRFLSQARHAGATVIDGTEMFIGQAARSFFHFTGLEFPVKLVRKVLLESMV
jgi:shikimate dehydrogenase